MTKRSILGMHMEKNNITTIFLEKKESINPVNNMKAIYNSFADIKYAYILTRAMAKRSHNTILFFINLSILALENIFFIYIYLMYIFKEKVDSLDRHLSVKGWMALREIDSNILREQYLVNIFPRLLLPPPRAEYLRDQIQNC